MELVALAEEKGFDGVQVYLNPELTGDGLLLRELKSTIAGKGMVLALHLPDAPAREDLAAVALLAGGDTPVTVHHPGTEDLELPAGRLALEFHRPGLQPDGYAGWLEACARRGAIPAFDLPRVFRGAPEFEARELAYHVLMKLADRRYILHLIDSEDKEQARMSWCELGRGRVGRFLESAVFPLPEWLVLEYESVIQSIRSLDFVRRMGEQLRL